MPIEDSSAEIPTDTTEKIVFVDAPQAAESSVEAPVEEVVISESTQVVTDVAPVAADVVVAEPSAPVEESVNAIEVEGVMLDPATVEPTVKAVGYYKSFDAGRDMTLALLPNGNLEWQVDLHDGSDPIVYIGTWVSGIDTFTARVAGVQDGNESLSDSYLFTRSADFTYTGQYMGTTVSFYQFKALAAGAIMPAL
ncbi:MAG TPA: hypothetical protein ENJ56_07345, partial [Anaerolineae bacterium]|nr:hypothetical protein [Anaerolineae bacterium]